MEKIRLNAPSFKTKGTESRLETPSENFVHSPVIHAKKDNTVKIVDLPCRVTGIPLMDENDEAPSR